MIPKPNTVIPYDDLQWNESEGRFAALSDEELDKILTTCLEGNVDSDESAMVVVRWAEHIRTGNAILQGILNGRLGITMLDGMDEPGFWDKEEEQQQKEEN
jgi:hypothetical protein